MTQNSTNDCTEQDKEIEILKEIEKEQDIIIGLLTGKIEKLEKLVELLGNIKNNNINA